MALLCSGSPIYRRIRILLVYSPRVIGKRKFPIDPGSKMAQRERLKAAIRINQQYRIRTQPSGGSLPILCGHADQERRLRGGAAWPVASMGRKEADGETPSRWLPSFEAMSRAIPPPESPWKCRGDDALLPSGTPPLDSHWGSGTSSLLLRSFYIFFVGHTGLIRRPGRAVEELTQELDLTNSEPPLFDEQRGYRRLFFFSRLRTAGP